jgi:hypothetical protein
MDFLGVYLTSHHMIAYKEFQVFGEANSVYPSIPNSPFYDYLLTGFLLLHDSLWTLAIVNLLFQCITLIFLYAIAYRLFGPQVAVLVGVYIALNQRFINQSHWVWQPTIAQPFFASSYFFFVYSYLHKNIRTLYASVLLFVGSLGIGLYGFVILPLFLLYIEISQRHMHMPRIKRLIIPLVCIMAIILVYFPIIIHIIQNNQLLFFLRPHAYIDSILHFPTRLIENVDTMLAALTRGTRPFLTWSTTVAVGILFIEGILYFISPSRSKRHIYARSILLSLLLTVIAASFLTAKSPYHFVGVTGLGIILMCEIVYFFWTQGQKYLTVIGIGAFFWLSMITPTYLHTVLTKPSITDQQERVVYAMLPTLEEIKRIYGAAWPEHFKIATDNVSPLNNPAADIFWVILDEKTQTKLTKIAYPGTWGHNFVPLGVIPSYMFVVCTQYETTIEAKNACLPKFFHDYPHHTAIQLLYEGMGPFGMYHLYVAKPLLTSSVQ